MTDINDEFLMAQFQAGHAVAFDLLFQRYRGPVFGFLCRMLDGRRETAEDLLQEIFVKIVKGRDLYDTRMKFSTWLFAIARNHCLNRIRSRAHRQELASEPLDAKEEGSLPWIEKPTAPQKARGPLEREEMTARMETAIRALPEAYREVFLLRAIEGFSHDETARVLRMTPVAVRVNYHRARQALRKALGAEERSAS